MTSGPLVSVVLRTKNEEKNIRICCESVKNQTYKNCELILVDNFSTDKTTEIAKEFTDNIHQYGPERTSQGNYGMLKIAKGKYVMYIDADMILSPNLLSACVTKLEQNSCIALHIKEIVLGHGYWSKVRRFERSFYNGTLIDGARFFLRESIVKVGGFDEINFKSPGVEDWDLDKKIKKIGKIQFLDDDDTPTLWADFLSTFISARGVIPSPNVNAIYHNEADFRLRHYLRKKAYYTDSIQLYIDKWGAHDQEVKKQLGFFYRYFTVFVGNGKWKHLLFHPLLSIGMYGLRLCVGVVYLIKMG